MVLALHLSGFHSLTQQVVLQTMGYLIERVQSLFLLTFVEFF